MTKKSVQAAMPKRRRSVDSEQAVLRTSARWCALCFCLNGDSEAKKGQLAHIDRRRSNTDSDNLAYLCLDHHDQYDTRSHASRGFSPRELRRCKHELEAAVAAGIHRWKPSSTGFGPVVDHDKRMFATSDRIMSERPLADMLAGLRDDHSYHERQLGILVEFCRHFALSGHQFADERIASRLRPLIQALTRLKRFLELNFPVFPENQSCDSNTRYCLHPDMNVDRGFPVSPHDRVLYRTYARRLERLVEGAWSNYRRYRQAVKVELLV
jgi:hypothetical protein